MDRQAPLIYRGRIIAEDVSELICCDGLATATLPETSRVVPVKKVEAGAGRTALFGLKCGWQSEGLTIETANYLLRPR
jgi:hypothetical protein